MGSMPFLDLTTQVVDCRLVPRPKIIVNEFRQAVSSESGAICSRVVPQIKDKPDHSGAVVPSGHTND